MTLKLVAMTAIAIASYVCVFYNSLITAIQAMYITKPIRFVSEGFILSSGLIISKWEVCSYLNGFTREGLGYVSVKTFIVLSSAWYTAVY